MISFVRGDRSDSLAVQLHPLSIDLLVSIVRFLPMSCRARSLRGPFVVVPVAVVFIAAVGETATVV